MKENDGTPPHKIQKLGEAAPEQPAPNYCTIDDKFKRHILACELLDTEHDLNRQAGQVSPLYLYTYSSCNSTQERRKRELFKMIELFVYEHKNRCKTMSPNKVATSMKKILENGDHVEYETIKTGKNINSLRGYIADTSNGYNFVNPFVVETIKGGKDENMDDIPVSPTQAPMTDIRRSKLSDRFDNNCPLISNNNNLIITIETTIGVPVGFGNTDLLQSTRIYPNHFPEAASVFVYKSELKLNDIATKILTLINNCSTSILPIPNIETSTTSINSLSSSLSSFIGHVNNIIDSDKDNSVYLLHIFRNMTYTADPNESVVTNTDIDGYNFSLQREQITLNEVTQQMGWGTKRGCFNSIIQKDIDNSKMIFSDDTNSFMKNCHAAYGKLCGDGVTAYVISEYYKRTGNNIPAILSIDEFCCLRTNIAIRRWWSDKKQPIIVASFQQKPTSKLSGWGAGSLYSNRTTEVITFNKHGVDRIQIEFDKKIQLLQIAEDELITAIKSFDSGNVTIIDEEDPIQIRTFESVITEDIFDVLLGNISTGLLSYIDKYRDPELKNNSIESIPEENKDEVIGQTIGRIIKDTNIISKVTNFYEQYLIALVSLSQVELPVSIRNNARSSRHTSGQIETIINNFFGRLSVIERLFDEAGMEERFSRIHITYIIITKVFTNPEFTNNLIGLIVDLFTNPDVLTLENNTKEWVHDLGQHTIRNYQNTYDRLKNYHDDMKPTARLDKLNAAIKLKIRRNLIILKYLIRALSAGYYAVKFSASQLDNNNSSSTVTTPIKTTNITNSDLPHDTFDSQPTKDAEAQKQTEETNVVLATNVNDIINGIQKNSIQLTFENIDNAYYVVTENMIKKVLTPLGTPGADERDTNYDPETLMSMLEYDKEAICVTEKTLPGLKNPGTKGGTRRKRRSHKPKRTRKCRKTGSKVKTRRRRRNHKKKRKTRNR